MQNCGRQISCIMGNVQLANGTVLGVEFCHAVSRAAFKWPIGELGSYCIPNNVPFCSSTHHRPSCSPGLQNGPWFDGEWVNTSQWPMHGKAKSLSFFHWKIFKRFWLLSHERFFLDCTSQWHGLLSVMNRYMCFQLKNWDECVYK